LKNKKTPPFPAVFSGCLLKGRKGEKEISRHPKLFCVWAQSPEERECRRESENPGPERSKEINPL